MQTATAPPPTAPPFPVRLIGSPGEWAALPAAVRRNVEGVQVKRLATIHAAIAAAARLPMPLLGVLPWGWPRTPAGRVVHARPASAWAIHLPAPTTFTDDDGLLRLLLTRGLHDCIRQVVRAAYREGDEPDGGSALSQPCLWFGELDTRNLLGLASWSGRIAAADALARAIVGARARDLYEFQAKERQKEAGKTHGRGKEKVPANLPEPIKGDARDQLGKAVGVSGKSIDRAIGRPWT